MPVLDGVVMVVQESRFLLHTDDGSAHLMLLSHAASAEPDQLIPLQRDQARVRVTCTQASGLIAYVAHSVEVLSPTAAT